MKTGLWLLTLLFAATAWCAPAEAHDRTVRVAVEPVAGLAVWGGSGGIHGGSAGWSGSVHLGLAPAYLTSAYTVAPAPYTLHGHHRGKAVRHAKRHNWYGHGRGHKRPHGRTHAHRHH